MSNVIYGKRKREDGTTIEDIRFRAKRFIDNAGNVVIKACFACKKCLTCEAANLEECKWETADNVACHPNIVEE